MWLLSPPTSVTFVSHMASDDFVKNVGLLYDLLGKNHVLLLQVMRADGMIAALSRPGIIDPLKKLLVFVKDETTLFAKIASCNSATARLEKPGFFEMRGDLRAGVKQRNRPEVDGRRLH